jgi:hypothetical protein
MIFRRARWRVVLSDAVLVALPVLLVLRGQGWGFGWLLALSGLFVWGINLLTLHFPHEVEITPGELVVRAYGRSRRYALGEVRPVVRRFVVKDRALVRLRDAEGRSRGAHWFVSDVGDVDSMIEELQRSSG